MRIIMKTIILTFLFVFGCYGCSSWSLPVVDKPENEPRKIGLLEANLDDDLNETEREAVAPIFEKDEKEARRSERAIIGID